MSVKITYFVHGTTIDNEKDIATGWLPGKLSAKGKKEAQELGKIIAGRRFTVVFSSDLKRAVNSAELAFGEKYRIILDKRLRECNYGNWNGKKKNWEITNYVEKTYPNGVSYKNVERRVKSFLEFLKEKYSKKHIAIVAHQGPQLALDVLLKGKTWKQAIREDWRLKKKWNPGWIYEVRN